ncbi:MAG: HDOD domain-containing protein [Methylovulum sp.]|nr:HDOD domain-containing protein [Methylovulum sp.]MCF7999293.1 HDOD domain-containing protein [Methylovulum sp.]
MTAKILIVDDNHDLRKLLAITLDTPDYQVTLVNTADDAVPLLTSFKPDLVITDVMMPGKMNGYQLCDCIKRNPGHSFMKVLLLTARGRPEDIKEGIRVKADAYMTKPFSPMLLQAKVVELTSTVRDSAHSDSSKTSVKDSNRERASSKTPSVEFSFPPRPTSLVNIQRELAQKTPDLRVIAQLIAADIALSAALLKTVNSPFYGLRNKVCSVLEAVNLIGINRTVNLISAESIRQSVPLPKGMENFWDDSTKTAMIGASIAKRLAMDPNQAYLLGLFHDAAVPLIATKYPDYLKAHLDFYNLEIEITESEQAMFNMNHAQLGSLLARSWYLPAALVDAIRMHHRLDLFTSKIDSSVLNLITVHLLADHIADTLKGEADLHYLMIERKVRDYLKLNSEMSYQAVVDIALDSINQE